MERKIEIPDFREDDEATMEDVDPAATTLASSEGSEDWEKISEDWVSLFLDSALLGDQSRSLESYSQFDTTLPETNDHFSSQDLLANSMLLHSTDDPLSHGDLVLGSASTVVEDLFGKEDCPAPQVDLIHPKREPTGATSSSSSVTQLSGGSSSGIEIEKQGNPDLSITLKRELNGEVSSGSESPTFPSSGGDSEFANNQLQGSSCKEGEAGSRDPGHEAVSRAEIPSTASQSETFGVRHLQSIGNTIKVGLLGRSGDDRKESNKPEICEAESFGLQNLEVPEDQQSDHSDADRKGEGGDEDDEKRRARLMRNRESAQLSRQRKKVYVDELEGKLRTMTATVAELNATISHLSAENVNLRRQLGYYFPAPGVCPPRPGMPMHVLPMGPYPGMVAGRPMFPGGQMPPVPIPRMKAQTPARSSKRAKAGATKEGGDKKRTKLKAAGAASMAVMGLLCVAMVFGSFEYGTVGVDDYSRVGNIRVGGRVLTSWNEDADPLNNTGFSKWDYGPGWAPPKPGEYGPEREGVPSIHAGLAFETELNQANADTTKTGFESSVPPSIDGSATLATSTSPGYFSSVKSPLQIGSEVVPANTSQSFAASVFIPGANGLVKVDGNLIIQAVMAGDKAAKKQSEKKRNSGLKKKKENKKQVATATVKKFPVKALDNLASRESKVVKNASTGPFVTARPLSGKVNSVVDTNNLVSPVLRAGSLQQWMLGGLQGPVLSTGMCTELFQFDTGAAATTSPGQGSSPEAKTMAESVAAKAASQGSPHNVTSPFVVPVVPRSRRDPFAVPLPPIKPKPSAREERRSNGTDPRVENTVREQLHNQNLRHGVSSMVVSVLAGPEDYGGDSRRKGTTKGLSQIFVVVLVDNQKYVTYSCMLPSGGPQAHVVAD